MDEEWARRARSFGSVAEAYDRYRPGYPDALYDDVLALAEGERVLEVGAGTGRATVALLDRGADVVALEPDPAMAAILRDRLMGRHVQVQQAAFEDFEAAPETFDLVVSAQAWHWVDSRRGPELAARLLRDAGTLALWWNRTGDREGAVWSAIDAAYAAHAPELADNDAIVRDQDRRYRAQPLPGFAAWAIRTYEWTASYSADDYVGLLATHSNHVLLPGDRRRRLTDAVHRAITDAGGQIEHPYRTVLLTTRRTA